MNQNRLQVNKKKMPKIPYEIALHIDSYLTSDIDSMSWLEACGFDRETIFAHWSREEMEWCAQHPRIANYFNRVYGGDLQIYELGNDYLYTVDSHAITGLDLEYSAQHLLNLGEMLMSRVTTYNEMFDSMAYSRRELPNEMQHVARQNMIQIAKVMRFCMERIDEITFGYGNQWGGL
jgi:hypothetical protein